MSISWLTQRLCSRSLTRFPWKTPATRRSPPLIITALRSCLCRLRGPLSLLRGLHVNITLRERNRDACFGQGLVDREVCAVERLEVFFGGDPVAQAKVNG